MTQQDCQKDLEANHIIPKKYYGQVFTTDPKVIKKFVQTVKETYHPETKVVEIGGGLGYLSKELIKHFPNIDIVEYDDELYNLLSDKLQAKSYKLIKGDILEYKPPAEDYILVGNIPFHISGKLYRRFMSELEHKPYAMVFITDKQYASTLMGQPPRCYRVSLQAQSYGDIEIVADVPPTAVYPEPKVMSCVMKIVQNDTVLPSNFWDVVNYHFENFPTKQVESPKTVGLKDWIELAKKNTPKNQ